MWADLGLDLDKHDALLAALGEGYQSVYLAQSGRPKAMEYFDFVMSEVHGLRVKELLDGKRAGKIVVGSFCVFVPEELILAANGIAVGLCAGAEFGTAEAERYLPRNTCSLIKSAFGFALEKVCPFIAAADVIVGENTCDGKKKSYEMFAGLVDDFYVMDMPQTKSAEGLALLRAEYGRLASKLETSSGSKITVATLKAAIATVNAKREAIQRLDRLRAARPAAISGLDGLLANQVFFYDDPARFTASVHRLCDEVEERIGVGQGVVDRDAPRLLISGCPMSVPNWKVHSLVEGLGAVVVGEESCVGARGTQNLTAEDATTVDGLLDAITDRYAKIDCAIFTPNPGRVDHVASMASELGADGVIHYALQFCTPYQMEAPQVDERLTAAGVPVLCVESDYSTGDAEQLRTRIGAFIEQLRR